MLRGFVIAFVAGWLAWFWLDKSPQALGPLPPPMQEQLGANFQMAVDLVKAGRYTAAFVYLWKAHYLVLSLAAGLVLAMLGGSLSRLLARRRFTRLYIPARKGGGAVSRKQTPAQREQTRNPE